MTSTNQIQYKTMTELVIESLREKIITGDIKTGERIQQMELAKEFNVSKNPIREALLHLQAEGFVIFEANKGVKVIDINLEQIDELFALKVLLEIDLLKTSLLQLSSCQLLKAKGILHEFSADIAVTQWSHLEAEFLSFLYSGANRPQTQEMLTILNKKLERYTRLYLSTMADKITLKLNYHNLLNFCTDGKIENAVQSRQQQILSSRDEIKNYMTK